MYYFLLFLLFFLIPVLVVLYHVTTRKYLNPYKLTMIFGKKGCGKSTYLTKLALQHIRKGWTVYSTEPIPGTYTIQPEQVGFIELEPNSVLLMDEVGMCFDNRNFKNFKPEVRDWFKLQRHRRVKVYLFSQTFDIDKKLRDLTDEMYLIEKKFRVFSYGKRILKKTVLHASTPEAPSRLDEDLKFDLLLLFPFGSRRFTFIPRYTRYFDSFVCSELKKVPLTRIPDLDLPRTLQKKVILLNSSGRQNTGEPGLVPRCFDLI